MDTRAAAGSADIIPTMEGEDAEHFAPLTLVAGQTPRRDRSDLERAWRNLMASILAGALRDLGHRDPKVRAAAGAWFAQPDSAVTVYLTTACTTLCLNTRRASRNALRWAGLA